jgi:hypothetical protein
MHDEWARTHRLACRTASSSALDGDNVPVAFSIADLMYSHRSLSIRAPLLEVHESAYVYSRAGHAPVDLDLAAEDDNRAQQLRGRQQPGDGREPRGEPRSVRYAKDGVPCQLGGQRTHGGITS